MCNKLQVEGASRRCIHKSSPALGICFVQVSLPSFFVRMYMYMYVYVYVCVYVCMYIGLFVLPHLQAPGEKLANTYTPIHLYAYTHIHLYTYTPIHLYTYTPIYLYTYTPIHLYKHSFCFLSVSDHGFSW